MIQDDDSDVAVRARMAAVGYCEHGARFEDCLECRPDPEPPYRPYGPWTTTKEQ